MELQDAILRCWFGPGTTDEERLTQRAKWWKKDPVFDEELRLAFTDVHTQAVTGQLEHWRRDALGCLAYVILIDQFSRNMFRDDPRSWTYDPLAQHATLAALDMGFDQELSPVQRVFLYMPLMHAEDAAMQRRSLEVFAKLRDDAPEPLRPVFEGNYDYAVRHAEIVERFGRYPHRNAVLGRPSTEDELAFLQEPNSSF